NHDPGQRPTRDVPEPPPGRRRAFRDLIEGPCTEEIGRSTCRPGSALSPSPRPSRCSRGPRDGQSAVVSLECVGFGTVDDILIALASQHAELATLIDGCTSDDWVR